MTTGKEEGGKVSNLLDFDYISGGSSVLRSRLCPLMPDSLILDGIVARHWGICFISGIRC